MEDIILIIIAILLIAFANYGKKHPVISKNEMINSLNTKTIRTLATILGIAILIIEGITLFLFITIISFVGGIH